LNLHAADNTASNGVAFTFTSTLLNGASISTNACLLFCLIMIILSFVKDEGATKDRVRSPHSGILISVFVLSHSVETCLDVLDVSHAATVNVVVGVTTLLTHRVENRAGRITTVLNITILVNFQGMEARFKVLKLTNHGDHIARCLGEDNTSSRVRVSKEIKLAVGGNGILRCNLS